MGLFAGAECGDAGIQRFGIITLVALNNHIVALTGVEVRDLTLDQLAKAACERMPKMDFRLRHCGHRRHNDAGGSKSTKHSLVHDSSKAPDLVRYQFIWWQFASDQLPITKTLRAKNII